MKCETEGLIILKSYRYFLHPFAWIKKAALALVALMFLCTLSTQAQQLNRDQFGKNRIQYKNFDWRFFASDNFEIYFYDGGDRIARQAAEYLEAEFVRLTDLVGYAPYAKTKVFVYNSVTDLQQSNIGYSESQFEQGGQMNFVKPNVEVAYPGIPSLFRQELIYKISEMLITDMMFGGSTGEIIQNSFLMALPDWFIKGGAAYIAYGWSVEMDDYMRDFFSRNSVGSVRKLSKYSNEEAKIIGQSIWNYIAEYYGRSNISNILNLTRIIRNEENSISNTLGVSFRIFLGEWQVFYGGMAREVDGEYERAVDSLRLRGKNRKGWIYKNIRISPDGKYVAYSEAYNGRYRTKVKNNYTGAIRTVHTGGANIINQEIDRDLPIMSWTEDNVLAVIEARRGKTYLWLLDFDNKRRSKKEVDRFGNIKHFDISDNGAYVVMSADVNGQNDLYLLNLTRNSIRRLTNDVFDAIYPKFIPGTNRVVFSSNRTGDSLKLENNVALKDFGSNHNLFIFDLDTTRNVLVRLTNTISQDINPVPVNEEEIYFLSDTKGIFNVYRYSLRDSITTEITNFRTSLFDFDVERNKRGIAFIMLQDGKYYPFYEKSGRLDKNTFPNATRRQNLINAKFVSKRIQLNTAQMEKGKETKSVADTVPPVLLRERKAVKSKTEVDYLNYKFQDEKSTAPGKEKELVLKEGELDVAAYQFDEEKDPKVVVSDSVPQVADVAKERVSTNTDIINTDGYVFDTNVQEKRDKGLNFLSTYRKLQKETKLLGPFPYEPRFTMNKFVSNLLWDPLIGIGMSLEAQMNDVLENHRFYGRMITNFQFNSSENFAEYQYLKYWMDLNVRFYRRALVRPTEIGGVNQKYVFNKIQIGGSLPLSVTSRIAVNPYYGNTAYLDLDPIKVLTGRLTDIERDHVVGVDAEYVFDNTMLRDINTLEGTRFKISYTLYQNLSDASQSFNNVQMDFRHYQPIHKNIIWATKISAGHFFGPNQPRYLLGGMENWVFPQTDFRGNNDVLQTRYNISNPNILFHRFATNMRGFNLNTFNGHSMAILNTEIRVPIARYLYSGPVSSNFLRNLQFVGFYDMGSAWTGRSPFDPENDLQRTRIQREGSSFIFNIKNYGNPWVSSYGAGVRTTILNYYMKFDLAWPVRDLEVKNPRLFVSLGYDF